MNEELKSLFSKILEDNKYRIMRICKAYSQNKEDQSDLLQEVALNIWKSLPSFRQSATYDTWVYRIGLNVCMQYAMKLNREKRVRVDIEGIEVFDDSTDLQKNLENDEKANRLRECIANLQVADISLVLLFLEDLSYKAIAEVMGITENHVAVKLNRIKKKLYNCFKF